MESLGRLGIDIWSLLLYAVNFGVIVFIIGKYFTKPLLDIIDKRRKQIADNISEAERLKKELVRQREKMEEENEEIKAQVGEEMKKLHRSIDKLRKEAEADIDASKAKMIADVTKVMNEEKANLQGSVQKEMLLLVEKMVLYIVHNKIPKEVIEESTEEAWKLYKR